MARTLQITDGTTTVSLVAATQVGLAQDGHLPPVLTADAFLLPPEHLRYTEQYKLQTYGANHDTVASDLKSLRGLLRKAWQYQNTLWQRTPVYLVEQSSGESNARYAFVYDVPFYSPPEIFDLLFERHSRALKTGFTIVRGIWRSGIPGTLPTAITLTGSDGPNATAVPVVNFRDDNDFTHLYNYDSSLAAFSANMIAATGITLWSVSGSVPADEDIVYIGRTNEPGHHFAIEIATAGVFSCDIAVEAWDGAAWAGLTLGTHYTIYPGTSEDTLFQSTGLWVLNFGVPPSGFATTAINGVTAFWYRLRINTFTSWTTTPVSHASQAPYTLNTPYIEIPSSALAGDLPPAVLLRMFSPHGGSTTPAFGALSRIIIGARSHDLTNFVSHLNCGNQDNPAAWAATYGTDTAAGSTVVINAPSGYYAVCTFATDQTSIMRVRLTGTSMLDDWRGEYRVFLPVVQSGGAAGDVSVKLRTHINDTIGPRMDGPAAKTTGAVGTAIEILDLGTLKLPFHQDIGGDLLAQHLIFDIVASAVSATPDLYFYSLIFIPIDEWSTELQDPLLDTSIGATAFRGSTGIDDDGGVLENRTALFLWAGSDRSHIVPWNRVTGIPPRLEPAKQTRLFFMMANYPVTFGTGPLHWSVGGMLVCEVYHRNVYEALRGNG